MKGIVDQNQVKEEYHLGVEGGWENKERNISEREVRKKIPKIYLQSSIQKSC